VFACDFSRLNPRADLPGPCRCAGALARRPRPPCGSFGDLEDRRRLRDAILSRPAGPHLGGVEGRAATAPPHERRSAPGVHVGRAGLRDVSRRASSGHQRHPGVARTPTSRATALGQAFTQTAPPQPIRLWRRFFPSTPAPTSGSSPRRADPLRPIRPVRASAVAAACARNLCTRGATAWPAPRPPSSAAHRTYQMDRGGSRATSSFDS
jgi:hypothetical protein